MIDKYKETFQEEARELLAELESALLELNRSREDPEVVGRAFRALHTIKGSGAMFGFDAVASFAHGLETAFDRVRSGKLIASSGLINLSLAAADHIQSMLQEAGGGDAADPARGETILAELRQITKSPDEQPVAASAEAAPPPIVSAPARTWKIHFRPGPDVLLRGTNPLLLLRELSELGELRVSLNTDGVPPLGEIDPERCYLAWDLVLTGRVEASAIRDVFIFIEDECALAIEPVAAAPGVEPAEAPEAARARQNSPEPRAGQPPGAASSIRVTAEKLDQFVNLVGELVTVQARLSEIATRHGDPDILSVSEEVERLTGALRENSMSVRMLPLRTTFERFRRLIHDLSIELHKEVELTIEGADTELDKTVIDQLNDPLVHLIRNSMDHGLETPEARRAAGKSPAGRIHLSAQHSGAHVLIRVSDDGRGLDAAAVRARAIEQRLIDAAAQLSDPEIFALIMTAGFSTAREVTGLSGRGVGMDVVRRSVEALRGSIEISSSPGAGMAVTLRLPLTLAIIDGLLVRIGDAYFVLPLANSLECIELTRKDIQDAHGNHMANVRGQIVPYIRLSEHLQLGSRRPEREQIMVVETEHGRYGFVVDQVLGDHQTVIKSLGKLYRNVQVVSGATILGNGTVALILDPHRLVQNVLQASSRNKRNVSQAGLAVTAASSR